MTATMNTVIEIVCSQIDGDTPTSAPEKSTATPSTMPGTMCGTRTKTDRAVVPRNLPRTQASAVGTPNRMHRAVTISPTFRLVHIEPTSSVCSKTSAYQRRVNPSGGKLTKARVSKEMVTTMIEGAISSSSEKTAMNSINPIPRMSPSDAVRRALIMRHVPSSSG